MAAATGQPAGSGAGGGHAGPGSCAPPAGRARRRARRTPLRRRLKKALRRVLAALAAAVLPELYFAYVWFVWRTSRVDDRTEPVMRHLDTYGRVVCPLWHQEVFTVAYAYRRFRPATVASPGDVGEVIARLLARCGYHVLRGGSSSGKARRRQVLPQMIAHMRGNRRVLYGITVDGSRGPALCMKPGAAVLARACGAAVWVVRTFYSRRLELPSWDRTAIPLPFGRIRLDAVGPYWIDPAADERELEAFRRHLEEELRELYYESYRWFGRGARLRGAPGLPAGWRPRWGRGRRGRRRTRYDLDPAHPPPWAGRSGAVPAGARSGMAAGPNP
ncbi:MAG: hypothetical protein KatS3mg102_2257 [Planctomycetota bacterium]|nr:MAG: hypothetical protein KatS3mg102_2257 [Planctomycetota bacterium]